MDGQCLGNLFFSLQKCYQFLQRFGQEMEFDWGPIKAKVVMSRTGESSIRRVIKLNNGKTILTTYDFDEDIVTKRQTVEGVTATRVYKRV